MMCIAWYSSLSNAIASYKQVTTAGVGFRVAGGVTLEENIRRKRASLFIHLVCKGDMKADKLFSMWWEKWVYVCLCFYKMKETAQ